MGVSHHDLKVSGVEGCVVVAAVPENEIGFFFGLAQDFLVVHAGVDDSSLPEVRLVLLTFFNRALVALQIFHGGEALHGLSG